MSRNPVTAAAYKRVVLMRVVLLVSLLSLCFSLSACSARPAQTANEWRVLFDGSTLDGWEGYRTPGVVPAGWQIIDGVITRVGGGGDLVSAQQYGNFELEFEWRVPTAGNSGVLYRIDPSVETAYKSGPEYQVLDDAAHADGKSRLTSAGSVYALYESPVGHTKPIGEWNSSRIVADSMNVEHWLNGTRVASYTLWSADWEARVRASKFVQWPTYGRSLRGHIALQDHGDRVSYRNIRVKELP